MVSLYFEENTEKQIQKWITGVAKKTDNAFMLEKQVPPHMTIGMLQSNHQDFVIKQMEQIISGCQSIQLPIVSYGVFKPHVLYLGTVLTEPLECMNKKINACFHEINPQRKQNPYMSYHWMPHVTIARHLSEPQMMKGFHYMQANFQTMEAKVDRIGLAETNPHNDIKIWTLS